MSTITLLASGNSFFMWLAIWLAFNAVVAAVLMTKGKNERKNSLDSAEYFDVNASGEQRRDLAHTAISSGAKTHYITVPSLVNGATAP